MILYYINMIIVII